MISVSNASRQSEVSRFDPGIDARRADWRIRKAVASMRSETRRGAGLDTFAREAGLSRAHFFPLFEASIGVPPKVYLNVVRMEKAVDAVLNQSASVCDISNHLGFAEPRISPALPQPCRREARGISHRLPARDV